MNLTQALRLAGATVALAASVVSAVAQVRRAQQQQPAPGTAGQVLGDMTRTVKDGLEAYRIAGFSDTEAKQLMRQNLRTSTTQASANAAAELSAAAATLPAPATARQAPTT